MIETLNTLSGHWYHWQLAMLWQTAVLIAIIAGIDLLIRKWAWPQVRYALWMLVLVKLLIPPTLTSPASITAQLPTATQKAITAYNSLPAQGQYPEGGRGLNRTQTSSLRELEQQTHVSMDAYQTQAVTGAERIVSANPPADVPVTLSWTSYAMALWLAGIGVLSAWLLRRLSGLRNGYAACHPGPRAGIQSDADGNSLPERFSEQLRAAADRLGLKRLPQVVLTDRVSCPAVFGIFRPVLLMPAETFKHMSTQETEHILLHEMAHIKRGDLLVHGLYMTLQIAYWFNPLLWLIRRTLQNLRELCCDATVARLLREDTAGYRQTLLETARWLLAEPVDPGLGLLGLFENSNWLITRLHWLEKKTWKNRPLRIATIIILVSVMVTCVLPMANRIDPGSESFVKKVDGARIELVAVNHFGAKDGWWNPDGSPCRLAIDTEDHNQYPAENPGYELVFRIDGAQNPMPRLAVKGGNPQSALTVKSPEGLVGWRTHIKAGVKQTKVQLGILGDNWQTVATHSGRGTDARVIGRGKVVFSLVQQTEGGLTVTISNDLDFAPAKRLVAVDQSGTVHPGQTTGNLTFNGLHQLTQQFDGLAPGDIKEFQFQTQDYTWVTFKDVALRPQTEGDFKVTGTVTDAVTGQHIADAEVFDDGYNDGKYRTTADENGRFTLYTAKEEHTITAKAEGYQTQTKTLKTWPFVNNDKFDFQLSQNFPTIANLPNGSPIKPTLEFLSWQNTEPKEYWYPNGTIMTNEDDLQIVSKLSAGQSSAGNKNYEWNQLWFSHPQFDELSFTNLRMIDAAGHERPFVMEPWGNFWRSIKSENGRKWISTHVSIGEKKDYPDTCDYQLDYAVGSWTTLKKIETIDYFKPVSLGDGFWLEAIYEKGDDKTVIEYASNKKDSFRIKHRFVVLTDDGMNDRDWSRGWGESEERFSGTYTFSIPLSQIKEIQFQIAETPEVDSELNDKDITWKTIKTVTTAGNAIQPRDLGDGFMLEGAWQRIDNKTIIRYSCPEYNGLPVQHRLKVISAKRVTYSVKRQSNYGYCVVDWQPQDIQGLEIQARKIETVIFKNVVLTPGGKREVEVDGRNSGTGGQEAQEAVTSDMLEAMLAYIEVPREKWDTYKDFIRKTSGELTDKEDDPLIAKLANIKTVDDYLSLVCPESRIQLQTTPQGKYWLNHIRQQIEQGTFPYEMVRDAKAFWMIKEYDRDLSDFVEFAVRPTHVLNPFMYHKEKQMLIGGSIHIHKQNGNMAVVSAVLPEQAVRQLKESQDPAQGTSEGTQNFTATLPNDITVELLGVADIPAGEEGWWAADGEPIENVYWDGTTRPKEETRKARQVVLRIASDETDPDLKPSLSADVKRHSVGEGAAYVGAFFVHKDSQRQTLENHHGLSFSLHDDHPTVEITATVSHGLWQTLADKDTGEQGNLNSILTHVGTLVFNDPAEQDGKTILSATLIGGRLDAWRCIAIDIEGRQHTSNSAVASGTVRHMSDGSVEHQIFRVEFRKPLSEIAKFQFQTRKTEKVTFKNIALNPGSQTDVEISVGEVQSAQNETTNAPGSSDTIPWSEAAATLSTLRTGLRVWGAKNPTAAGSWTQDELTLGMLGFEPNDVTDNYFSDKNYTWQVFRNQPYGELTYKITATADNKWVVIDQDHNYTNGKQTKQSSDFRLQSDQTTGVKTDAEIETQPSAAGLRSSAQKQTLQTDLNSLFVASQVYHIDNGKWPETVAVLLSKERNGPYMKLGRTHYAFDRTRFVTAAVNGRKDADPKKPLLSMT